MRSAIAFHLEGLAQDSAVIPEPSGPGVYVEPGTLANPCPLPVNDVDAGLTVAAAASGRGFGRTFPTARLSWGQLQTGGNAFVVCNSNLPTASRWRVVPVLGKA